MTEAYNNKQVISDRIRRFAAGYYSLSQVDLLDPVSNLFLESLGEEIYKLSGEIERMESRILDKLSTMLIPGQGQSAFPSHTILHAKALTLPFEITTKTPFRSKRTYGGKTMDISFYPVCNTLIYPGDIKFFVYKGQFYTTEIYGTKTLLTRSKNRSSFSDRTFWLGIELDDTVASVENLSFYIDLAGSYNKETYLKELSQIVLNVDGQELSTRKGLSTTVKTEENKILNFYSVFDNSNIINKKIKTLYDSHYLSVKGNLPIEGKKKVLPESLKEQFDVNLAENIKTPLLWIEIICPQELPLDVVDSLQISINTFPVVCKELVRRTEDIDNIIPVIPLRTASNESFLSVCSLTDSEGHKYYDIPIKDASGKDCRLYSLRRGGYERFNERDCGEYLSNAIQTLDSEASSFFRNRKDMKTEMKQIRLDVIQVLKDLKKTASQAKDKLEVENYLLLNQKKDWEIYFLEYWVINYEIANGMRAGSIFRLESDIPVSLMNPISLLPVTGGHPALTSNERYAHYKKGITKSSLITTQEDIIRFCEKELTGTLKRIAIKAGYKQTPDKNQGFLRTTDVYIQTTGEKDALSNTKKEIYLKEQLQAHSPATFCYRVFLT